MEEVNVNDFSLSQDIEDEKENAKDKVIRKLETSGLLRRLEDIINQREGDCESQGSKNNSFVCPSNLSDHSQKNPVLNQLNTSQDYQYVPVETEPLN